MSLKTGTYDIIPFVIAQTELLAGTSYEIIAPNSGYISELGVTVQTAVTTGDAITVATGPAGATTVTGLSVTVADAATKGTRYTDEATVGTSERYVAKGERVQIIPGAAFATAGAVNGYLRIDSADTSPALPAA